MHVEIRGLRKNYRATRALDDLSLTIPPGQLVALIGLNGSGKTTLLRCLSGLVSPSRGAVFFDGEKFHRERLDFRRRLMFLPDSPVIDPGMSVLEYTSLALRMYDRDAAAAEDTVIRSLAELDLLPLATTPMAHLSRGQLYKAALTTLRAVDPELWLLDEPFASGLDPQGLAVLKQMARARVAAGGTVLYSTQILEIAEKFADVLLVVDHGRLATTFTRTELDALPAEGPESLEARLRQFREPSP